MDANMLGYPKQLLSGILIAVALTASGAGEPASATDQGGKTVVVIGDSISAAYGIQTDQGWVSLLQRRLGAAFEVVNASISGDTTSGGLARLPRTLETHKPDLVIVELGGNDGLRGYPIANIHANLLAMTEAVIAAGAVPVLAGMRIPPNYGPRYTRAFHGIYTDVAAATGAALVPFLLDGVATDAGLMQRDGIHPTAAAQPRLLDNAWPILKPLLQAP